MPPPEVRRVVNGNVKMALSQKVLSALRSVGCVSAYGNFVESVRKYSSKKHYDPRFRSLRRKKFEIQNILDLDAKTKDHIKRRRSLGLTPLPRAQDIPYHVGSSLEIIDPYVPKEGDGQYSSVYRKISDSIKSTATKKSKHIIHLRKLKKLEPTFDIKSFPEEAKEIYINAHQALASQNLDELEKYTTERAYNLMTENAKRKTIMWKFIESLDPPEVVQVRTGQLLSEDNYFGQVTVRFHTKQVLAIFDRFGRLMYGSEILAKDVLEFVVFERHLSNVYGTWKVHDKIIPDWLPPKEPLPITYRAVAEKDTDELLNEELSKYSFLTGVEEEGEGEGEGDEKQSQLPAK